MKAHQLIELLRQSPRNNEVIIPLPDKDDAESVVLYPVNKVVDSEVGFNPNEPTVNPNITFISAPVFKKGA